MSDPQQANAIFSDELQTLLQNTQHPMAQQFREFVVKAIEMQNKRGGKKSISFTPEILLEVADEVDTLLGIIHALAEIVQKQTQFSDDRGPKPGEYLS